MAGVQKMTRATMYVLEFLLEQPSGPTPTAVMDATNVSPQTVHRVLLRLVDDGHATRTVDGRNTRYQLTPEGAVWARVTVHDYVTLTPQQRRRKRFSERCAAGLAGGI